MHATVEEVTGVEYIHRAMRQCGATREYPLAQLYRARHSVLYARQFWLEIQDVSERVHTHLVRSRVGVSWWVATQRPDRGGVPGQRDLSAIINAEALITLAQKRLCHLAWYETRETVEAIRDGVRKIDPALADAMQPRCWWERGCHELHPCGMQGVYVGAD